MLLLLIAREESPEKAPERKSRIGEVIRYIHSHYQEEISLEMLAQMFYVSPYYLCREFKKNTKSTIIRYINETSKNITDISKETGFSNLTHLNRVFKAVTGMSPSQYRKQFRDNVKS